MRRHFTRRERAALIITSSGRCAKCGTPLEPGWHADHVRPVARGGETDVVNGQALCPRCNLLKADEEEGNTMTSWKLTLRSWQERAFDAYSEAAPRAWLVEATPGAGKTRLALRIAHELLWTHQVERLVVVAHTDYLRRQWARVAHDAGIQLNPNLGADTPLTADYRGAVVTYQLVVMNSLTFRRLATEVPTLVIFDEIHHAADRPQQPTWGTALRQAFDRTARKLCLSGTPFRSDTDPMPFVTYRDGRSVPDFRYSYGDALEDSVCRPITFPSFEGEVRYWDRQGQEQQRRFADAETEEQQRDVLRAVLDPEQAWVPDVLERAHRLLLALRESRPDAGGLVVCQDTVHARAVATVLHHVSGEAPLVVTYDDPEAAARIDDFRAGHQSWLIAVRMVSEGVDIPRLLVGVYATNALTELFFRQFVGRFVRTQSPDDTNVAALYLPAAPPLLDYARCIQDERDHVLQSEDDEMTQDRQRSKDGETERQRMSLFRVDTAQAEYHGDIYRRDHFTAAEMKQAQRLRLELGLARPDVEVARALRKLGVLPVVGDTPPAEMPVFEERERLSRRQEKLARQVAITHGKAFEDVNRRLAEVTGARKAEATVAQLRQRIALCQQWLQEGVPLSASDSREPARTS